MNLQDKIYVFVFTPVIFILGILFGAFVLVIPCLQFQTQINILDAANLLVTIIIAIMIPLFITKLIDDNRNIKACLIDEIKEIIKIVTKAKDIVSEANDKESFCDKDRDRINYAFHEAELKVNSFQEQIKIAFSGKSEETNKELKDLLFNYKQYLTGGELMMSRFKSVDDHFLMENNTEFSKIETGLRTIIQKIHKF